MKENLEKYIKHLLIGYFIYSVYVVLCYIFIPSVTLFLLGKSIPIETLIQNLSFVKALIFIFVLVKIYFNNKKGK